MVLPDDPTQGLLIDLDVAARVDENGAPLDNFPLPHPGTLAFRAEELVNPNPPTRSLYRHDLESFLYTLVWITQSKTDIRPEAQYSDWLGGRSWGRSWDDLRGYKSGFLAQGDNDEYLPKVDGMTDLLRRLRTIFAQGFEARRRTWYFDDTTLGGMDFDDITFGGMVTFERFTDVLHST